MVLENEGTVAIRCTEENAAEFRALVKAWPELQTLVTDLQAAGHFPGLRGLTLRLQRAEARRLGGVGALAAEIAAEVAQEEKHAA